MRKSVVIGLIVSGFLLEFSGESQGDLVQASTWHHGIPQILKHTKWHHGTGRITFGTKWFSLWGPTGGARWGIGQTNVKYEVVGHHKYKISHQDSHSFGPTISYAKYVSYQKLIWKWDKSSQAVSNYRYYHWG
ncbi:hypothetical protein [Levilactobacillus tangyuanensis]|uniref:hypothetical protein n=1 Tax=Levilactobacillus tangyuanensis TaxID=2486021 RepID=UPI000F77ED47|nr:hypothetical protein [Levilactobacillus tangyuanensis]